MAVLVILFQSTQPKRAATSPSGKLTGSPFYFNPRSPRGLRQLFKGIKGCCGNFNPRSPRGLRPKAALEAYASNKFQSTQPKRAATALSMFYQRQRYISIHAAQEGCDNLPYRADCRGLIFQSTQPKRAATITKHTCKYTNRFQSTQPKRAATNVSR